MNSALKVLAVTAALVGTTALPAQAQAGWGALGLHASWMNPANVAEGPVETLNFDESVGIGGDLDLWFGESRRWGLGLEGTWSGWTAYDPENSDDFGEPTDLYQYDASLQVRLAAPTQDTRALPWLSLGIGGVTVNPDNDPEILGPREYVDADVRITRRIRTEMAVVGGVGLDYFISPSAAFRLEFRDYWTENSPYLRLSNGEKHDGGHNLLLNAGVAFYWGGARVEEPGFAAAPVEPMLEPEIALPVEEDITVCVIDEDGFALETISAVRVPTENRIYVTENGQRVAFSTAHPALVPTYVRNASWYMNDEALMIDLEADDADIDVTDRNRIELVLFGSPAQRPASALVFVGTIDGTPVYASRTDVSPFQQRLESSFATTTDLEEILEADVELASEFTGIETYYVAVEPDCVF